MISVSLPNLLYTTLRASYRAKSLLKKAREPLPLVAAQNRRSELTATYRAATKGSGILQRVFQQAPKLSATVAALLAKHPDLDVFFVHVDGKVLEVVNQLFQVLGLDLVQVEFQAFVLQSGVHAIARFRWNQAGELNAGAQQLHRHADVHGGGPIVFFIRRHYDAQVFDLGFRARIGTGHRWGR